MSKEIVVFSEPEYWKDINEKNLDICAFRACNFFCTWIGAYGISGIVPPTTEEIRDLFVPPFR